MGEGWGEGTRPHVSLCPVALRLPGLRVVGVCLPLPVGEGWGEGTRPHVILCPVALRLPGLRVVGFSPSPCGRRMG
ncbi:hypothetical protein A6J71_18130 [Enterobacter cancerogenus]|nr:hypothetical protein A6J71_18130 [Enterobacter cancerogenus]